MKTMLLLKKLIDWYFYFLLLGFLVILIVAPMQFMSDKKVKISFSFIDFYDISTLSVGKFSAILLFGIVLYFYFVKAVYLFKNLMKDLINGSYFSELVIANFNKIGKCFIICGVGFSVFRFVLRLMLISEIKIGIDNDLILFTITGLFFMFLSEVFSKARGTEQENELTI